MTRRCEHGDLFGFLMPGATSSLERDAAGVDIDLNTCLKGLLSFFDAARPAEERAPESSE